MKNSYSPRQSSVLKRVVARFLAGIMVLLWLARGFVRLMPRVLGGEGVYAWAELAERAYRAVER